MLTCMRHYLSLLIAIFLLSSPLNGTPAITSVIPCCGSVEGMSTITITGSGFSDVTSVNFGNLSAIDFTIFSDTVMSAIVPSSTPGTIDIILSDGSNASPITRSDRYTYQGAWHAFVTNMGEITSINLATNTPNTAFKLDGHPYGIALTPNGKMAYISTENGCFYPINLDNNTVGKPLHLHHRLTNIVITTDGSTAYIIAPMVDQVIPVNLNTFMPCDPISVGRMPMGIAITPDDTFLYVANGESNDVTPIDLKGVVPTPLSPIAVGEFPIQIAITSNGEKAYVVNAMSSSVTPIDIFSNLPGEAIPVGSLPFDIAITPDSSTAYVVAVMSGDITPIDTNTDSAGTPISLEIEANPTNIIITPDGKTAYIAITPNFIVPLDLSKGIFGELIPIEGAAVNLVISPDQAPVASFVISHEDTPHNLLGVSEPAKYAAGSTIIFDANGSPSPVGTIQNYLWNFGDGTFATTTDPIISHTYTSGGKFLASLQVVNSANTSIFQIYSGRSVQNNGNYIATLSRMIEIIGPPPGPKPPTPDPSSSLLPPTHLQGKQRVNRFITQSDIFNVVTWKAPTKGSAPVSYKIYKDRHLSKLIGTVSAKGELKFEDHRLKRGRAYTYYIVSVDSAGKISSAASITVKPKK